MHANWTKCEYHLLRCVPDVVRGEFVNVGVVLREAQAGGRVLVRLTRHWGRLRALTGELDVNLMSQLGEELAQRLVLVEQDNERRSLLAVAKSSFSTGLQLTDSRGALAAGSGAEAMDREMRRLMRVYVEPRPTERPKRMRTAGRQAVIGATRREFERAGVLELMRKGIPAAEYTGVGDSLRIDFGYRTESKGETTVRMVQAVSLRNDGDGAKVFAFSANPLREGVTRLEGARLELMAVVEPESEISSVAGWKYAVRAMQEAGVEVRTTAGLPKMAELARRELLM